MAGGMVIAIVLAILASWAVPSAKTSIWPSAFVAMVIVALLGIQPLRQAMREDAADTNDGTA